METTPGAKVDMVVIGVDVGGTNTDAVCLRGSHVVASSKVPTTENVTTGLKRSLSNVIAEARQKLGLDIAISRITIGTTHFVNAVIQRKGLVKVAVIRLCGTASRRMDPFIDFPPDLREIICSSVHLVNGGYQFNGEEIAPLDRQELIGCIQAIRASGVTNVVVCGIFSPVNHSQECQVAELFGEHFPAASLTLSHQVGQLGLLERENAAILNESLRPLCRRTLAALAGSLRELGLTCPFFLTENDGTVLGSEEALKFPVLTFSSGPTNSMRGAAKLSGLGSAIVIDIGGTSADGGFLVDGFPKQASSKVRVGGVNTNFQMPDVLCVGLGGGSRVRYKEEDGHITSLTIGPDSVGYLLDREAQVLGGSVLTASDIAVAAGLAAFGDPSKVAHLPRDLVRLAVDKIHASLEDLVDQLKLSADDVPLIIVGGGSILVDESRGLKGTSRVIKPPHYQVANAIGASLSQVGGVQDTVVSLNEVTREEALDEARRQAIQTAVQHGARPDSVQITEVTVTPLTYVTNNAARIKVKAVGDLIAALPSPGEGPGASVITPWPLAATTGLHQPHTAESQGPAPPTVGPPPHRVVADDDEAHQLPEPSVDPATGEWILSECDIECIAIGAGILGCGGGGSPHLGTLSAFKTLREGKRIRVIAPERLGSTPELTGPVIPIAFMGSPGVVIEKMESGTELREAAECLQEVFSANYGDRVPDSIDGVPVRRDNGLVYVDDYPRQKETTPASSRPGSAAVALMSLEIGGMNSLVPMAVAAMMDLPVVDCDGMGRAFPKLQMVVHSMYGHSLCPSVLVDDKGRRAVTFAAENSELLEDHFRNVVIEMGCEGALAMCPLSMEAVREHTIHYSLSRACRLGRAVRQARRAKTCPVQTILARESGVLLFTGKISDVSRVTTGGFAHGSLLVEGSGKLFEGQRLGLDFQNENLVARRIHGENSEVLATTPDLITIVDADLGQPVCTEELRYGLRVSVLVLASHPKLRTQTALDVVGPQAFGFPLDFTPNTHYTPPSPIPLPP